MHSLIESKPDRHAKPREIETLSVADELRALNTLTLAFAADPGVRWLLPRSDDYVAGFPRFARAFAGRAFGCGTAMSAASGHAVALWLPPGEGPDEQALADVIERHTPVTKRDEAFALLERMGQVHPDEPHMYLPLIGTDPARQGLGLGSRLLAHKLEQCDAQGLPAYLEATSQRNVPLYQRHGFVIVDILQVGSCPPITPMLRRPQASPHGRLTV